MAKGGLPARPRSATTAVDPRRDNELASSVINGWIGASDEAEEILITTIRSPPSASTRKSPWFTVVTNRRIYTRRIDAPPTSTVAVAMAEVTGFEVEDDMPPCSCCMGQGRAERYLVFKLRDEEWEEQGMFAKAHGGRIPVDDKFVESQFLTAVAKGERQIKQITHSVNDNARRHSSNEAFEKTQVRGYKGGTKPVKVRRSSSVMSILSGWTRSAINSKTAGTGANSVDEDEGTPYGA